MVCFLRRIALNHYNQTAKTQRFSVGATHMVYFILIEMCFISRNLELQHFFLGFLILVNNSVHTY